MSNITIDQLKNEVVAKAKRWKWYALGGTLLLAPLAAFILKAVVSLAAAWFIVTVVGALSYIGLQFVDVFIDKVKNKKLQLIIQEAADNPILTMENAFLNNESELGASRAAIEQYATVVGKFKANAQKHAREYPEDTQAIQDMQEEVRLYEQSLTMREERWRQANADQQVLRRSIDRMKSRYETSVAGIAANKLAKIGQRDIYQKIKMDTAYDAVMQKNAECFSALRTSLLDQPIAVAPPAQQLTHQPADVIEMEPIRQPNTVAR